MNSRQQETNNKAMWCDQRTTGRAVGLVILGTRWKDELRLYVGKSLRFLQRTVGSDRRFETSRI